MTTTTKRTVQKKESEYLKKTLMQHKLYKDGKYKQNRTTPTHNPLRKDMSLLVHG